MVRKFSPSDEVFGCVVTRETLDQLVELATTGEGDDRKLPTIGSNALTRNLVPKRSTNY